VERHAQRRRKPSLQLWHERLGHVNVAGVKRMIKNKDVDGLKCTSMVVKNICEPCVYGKAAMTPMPSARGVRVTKRLQLVHSDLGGPMSEPSRGGALYFGRFTEDFSRWTDVVFLHKKSDLLAEYKKWLTTKARSHTYTQAQATQPLHRGPPSPIPTAFQQWCVRTCAGRP